MIFKNIIQFFILSTLTLLLSSSCLSHNHQDSIPKTVNSNNIKFPNPVGYVNDYAKVLKSDELKSLEVKLKKYDESTTNQVTIVSLIDPIVTDDNFDQYALDLVRHWGVGMKEKNNGLAIVLSPNLRRVRILTGLGTEKILTDEICQDVLEESMLPEFKIGNYFEGINQGLDKLLGIWDTSKSD